MQPLSARRLNPAGFAVDANRTEGYAKAERAAGSFRQCISGRDTRVLMKLVVDAITDRVLGCHIVGDTAAEIIQAVAIAVKMKATKADFDATFALHSTAAEELVTMRTPTARYVREAAE